MVVKFDSAVLWRVNATHPSPWNYRLPDLQSALAAVDRHSKLWGYVFHDIPRREYRLAAHYFDHSVLAHYLHLDVDTITAIFAIIMTLTLAFLSYHFFESPILRMKDRFTSSNAR